jgi:hypothetical protein
MVCRNWLRSQPPSPAIADPPLVCRVFVLSHLLDIRCWIFLARSLMDFVFFCVILYIEASLFPFTD